MTAAPVIANSNDLDSIKARLGKNTVVHADFTQIKTLEAFKRPINSSGRLVVSQEHGVLWQVESPYQVTFVVKKDAFREIYADGTVKDRGSEGARSHSHISRLFEALFSGNTQELGKYFSVSGSENNGYWQLGLYPLEKMTRFLKNVVINGADYVDDITIEEAGGDAIKITFSHQSGSEPLSDDERRLFALE
jgi:hypothetical protein